MSLPHQPLCISYGAVTPCVLQRIVMMSLMLALGHRASGQWSSVYQELSDLHHRHRSLEEMPEVMSQGHGPA